jgi:Rieske Fe-S protein
MTDLDARFRHASVAVKERVLRLPLPNEVAGEPHSAPKPSRVLALLSAAALVLLVAGIAVLAIHSRTRVVTPGHATPRIVDVDVRSVAPGTVITTRYTVSIGELHKAPVFLARQPDGRFIAFLGRSTHLGCRIVLGGTNRPIASNRAPFYDPCGGSVWAIDGTCLGGPCPRNLDRFPLTIVAGHAHLDLSTILPGEPRRGNETPTS